MNTTPHHTAMVVGRALQSTVLIMGDLGSIGSDVLKVHDVFEIDIDGWYPAKLRQEIHEAAYKRFGPAALLNFGFSMGDHYSQASINASIGQYQSLMSQEATQGQALEWFIQNFTQAYFEATKASQKCEHIDYGFYSKQITAGVYEFNAVSTLLAHHEAFSEGIIRGYLVRFISHHWDFELTYQPDRTVSNEAYSSFHWICAFKLKEPFLATPEESMAKYKLEIKETLLKKVLEESNSALASVMSSVRYARLIQQAQLPQVASIRSKLKDFSVQWHPRDTIGGDLWWTYQHPENDELVIALIDCAGHGVPGAMLSVLVNSCLEKIFSNNPSIDLVQALMQLDDLVRKSLRQDLSESESDDGCDAALVRIHLSNKSVEYVGAKINLLELTGDAEILLHKSARISLGYRDKPYLQPQLHRWTAASGSRFVMVTDGITDQLGGTQKQAVAFGYKRMNQALVEASHQTNDDIGQHLLNAMMNWQGTQVRRDDLTIVIFEMK